MKAIRTVELGKAALRHDVPKPKLKDGYLLIKVKAVALNPTDWKHIHFDRIFWPDCTCGCDFMGVVEDIGSGISRSWSKGDRIAGFAHGVNHGQPEDGCFAEYALVKGDGAIRIPDNWTNEDAATLPIGVITVGLVLYQKLGFPWPGIGAGTAVKPQLLIYGASSATGTLAIQFATLSGWGVIAVCSEEHNELVRSRGAVAVFDYREDNCGQAIRAYTNDGLRYGLDCISDSNSARICCDAISSDGGTVATIGLAEYPREDITRQFALGYTYKGEGFRRDHTRVAARPEDLTHTSTFLAHCETILASGKLVPHPTEIRKSGLEGIVKGLEDLRQGHVRGRKLVYNISA